jgi:hypothetical protein
VAGRNFPHPALRVRIFHEQAGASSETTGVTGQRVVWVAIAECGSCTHVRALFAEMGAINRAVVYRPAVQAEAHQR